MAKSLSQDFDQSAFATADIAHAPHAKRLAERLNRFGPTGMPDHVLCSESRISGQYGCRQK